MDEANRRVTLSFAASAVASTEGAFLSRHLASIAPLVEGMPWRRHAIGTTADCEFVSVRPYGLLLTTKDSNASVLVPPACVPGGLEAAEALSPGKAVKARIIDVDAPKGLFLATLDPDVVRRGRPKQLKTQPALDKGDRRTATVLLLREGPSYAVVETEDGAVGFLQAGDYHRRAWNSGLVEGQSLEVRAATPSASGSSLKGLAADAAAPHEHCATFVAARAAGSDVAAEGTAKARAEARAARKAKAVSVGDRLKFTVVSTGAALMELELAEEGQRARKAIMDAVDACTPDASEVKRKAGPRPFGALKEGDVVDATVLDTKRKVRRGLLFGLAARGMGGVGGLSGCTHLYHRSCCAPSVPLAPSALRAPGPSRAAGVAGARHMRYMRGTQLDSAGTRRRDLSGSS